MHKVCIGTKELICPNRPRSIQSSLYYVYAAFVNEDVSNKSTSPKTFNL